MKDTTTANYIFSSLVGVLDKVGVDWSRAVSLGRDGAPSMVERKAGLAKNPERKYRPQMGDKFLGISLYFASRSVVLQNTKK
jgi:hypothetical protein